MTPSADPRITRLLDALLELEGEHHSISLHDRTGRALEAVRVWAASRNIALVHSSVTACPLVSAYVGHATITVFDHRAAVIETAESTWRPADGAPHVA